MIPMRKCRDICLSERSQLDAVTLLLDLSEEVGLGTSDATLSSFRPSQLNSGLMACGEVKEKSRFSAHTKNLQI
jgi:hypothetical protein